MKHALHNPQCYTNNSDVCILFLLWKNLRILTNKPLIRPCI